METSRRIQQDQAIPQETDDASVHQKHEVRGIHRDRALNPRLTLRQVYTLAAVGFVATFALLAIYRQDYSIIKRIWYSLLVSYLPSYLDGAENTPEGRYWGWFAQHPAWRRVYAYFPASIHMTAPLTPGRQYIVSSHPHGVYSNHHWNYVSSPDFQRFFPGNRKRHLGASLVFRIPLFREWMLWGGIVDADARVAHAVLGSGRSLVALTGGLSEQVRASPGKHFVYVRRRKGLFRLSLEYGVPIVPCYCFGEGDSLHTAGWAQETRNWLADKWRTPICFSWGRWGSTLPLKVPLDAAVGAPLEVEKVDNPTDEQVKELQERYIQALEDIFNSNKSKHGYADATLKVY
jgi:2-acylglycerol O-acyltransferase 2